MGFEEQAERIEWLDQMIRMKNTGPASQIAQKMNISERWAHSLPALMHRLRAGIAYDKRRRSYVYEEEGGFDFHFRKKT